MECAIVKRVDLDFAARPSHSGPHYPVGMRRSGRVDPKSFDLSMSPRLRPQDPRLSSCTSTASTCAAPKCHLDFPSITGKRVMAS
jgi:hypothetical protein